MWWGIRHGVDKPFRSKLAASEKASLGIEVTMFLPVVVSYCHAILAPENVGRILEVDQSSLHCTNTSSVLNLCVHVLSSRVVSKPVR